MTDSRLKYHDYGFLEVADKPTAEELKNYYAQIYYQTEKSSYRKEYSEDERGFFDVKIAQRVSRVQSIRDTKAAGTVLDVGCGEGFALAWFEANGWTVQGIDHSTAGLDEMHPSLLSRVEAGDIFAILDNRIADAKRYDVVWLTNVLEHVIDPVGLLVALRQLVSPGGVLVVTVPNDNSRYQKNLLDHGDIAEPFWIAIPDHLSYFNYKSLAHTADATGWDCRDIIADFPIDIFLLHQGANYVRDRSKGPAAHNARIRMELMLGDFPESDVNAYYSAMARVGLGRNLTAFLTTPA